MLLEEVSGSDAKLRRRLSNVHNFALCPVNSHITRKNFNKKNIENSMLNLVSQLRELAGKLQVRQSLLIKLSFPPIKDYIIHCRAIPVCCPCTSAMPEHTNSTSLVGSVFEQPPSLALQQPPQPSKTGFPAAQHHSKSAFI